MVEALKLSARVEEARHVALYMFRAIKTAAEKCSETMTVQFTMFRWGYDLVDEGLRFATWL
jgi:hypothetical protein